MQSKRAIGVDLNFRLYAVLDETAVDGAAGIGQRRQAFQFDATDAWTIEEDFARFFDEGTLNRDLDRGATLACARRDILDVMYHRACEQWSEQTG